MADEMIWVSSTMTDGPSTTIGCSHGRRVELRHVRVISPKHLEQYWGPWAISFEHADQFLCWLANFNFAEHPVEQRARDFDYELSDDGIATVQVQGMMTKRGSSFNGSPGTVELRRQISQAAANPAVRGIMLSIESPGGTAAGTKELADAVAGAAAQKPVMAYVEDLGASAAYYVASQANSIWANQPALVGSIGTFMVATDSSKMAEDMGITVHVVKAGDMKGAGTPGTPVTEGQLEYYQQLVNAINDDFLSAVRSGRRLNNEALAAVANGKLFLAADARAAGLIDQIGTFDRAMTELRRMADEQKPKAATLRELKSALPGAEAEFLVGQLESGATLEEAKDAWIVEQGDRLAKAEQQAKDAEAKLANGVEPIGDRKTSKREQRDTSAQDEWLIKVRKKREAGHPAHKAASLVNRENPGLREAMLAEVNA
jgi:signal peptide peptidase SppA